MIRIALGEPEIIIVVSNDDAILCRGESKMLGIRRTDQTCVPRGRHIDTSKMQSVGYGPINVLVKMETNCHRPSLRWFLLGLAGLLRLHGCDEFLRFFDLPINISLMVVVIRQSGIHVGQGEMRKTSDDFVRGPALLCPKDDIRDTDSGASHARFSAANPRRHFNMLND
jgi:hypothetical protein